MIEYVTTVTVGPSVRKIKHEGAVNVAPGSACNSEHAFFGFSLSFY